MARSRQCRPGIPALARQHRCVPSEQLLNIGSLEPLSSLLHLRSDAAQPLDGLSDRSNVAANYRQSNAVELHHRPHMAGYFWVSVQTVNLRCGCL